MRLGCLGEEEGGRSSPFALVGFGHGCGGCDGEWWSGRFCGRRLSARVDRVACFVRVCFLGMQQRSGEDLEEYLSRRYDICP